MNETYREDLGRAQNDRLDVPPRFLYKDDHGGTIGGLSAA